MQISIANIIRGTLIGNTMSVLTRYISRVVNGGGIVEAPQCVETALNSEPLLEQASLVMIPSGYKEDIVYSQIPTSGAGDLSFTRASNGTRINSAGLVEDVPWNLLQYSEDFSNAYWVKTATVTSNTTISPNGNQDADTVTDNSTSYQEVRTPSITITANATYTASVFIKKTTGALTYYPGIGILLSSVSNKTDFGILNTTTGQIVRDAGSGINSATYSTQSVGDYWRVIVTFTDNQSNLNCGIYLYPAISSNGTSISPTAQGSSVFWGAQLNIGSTAKPYFPTTDRLNVPRLTYQNGGGGCPSLLLEPQRTNLALRSEEFDNASSWALTNSGTITANSTISPDGTQTADTLNAGANSAQVQQAPTGTSGAVYTVSIWVKRITGTGNVFLRAVENADTLIAVTSDWQRFTATVTSTTTTIRVGVKLATSGDAVAIWGAQIELGAYPTSYIPTTSSSATRVADFATTNNISTLFGSTEGSFFVDMTYDNGGASGSIPVFLRSSISSSYLYATYLQCQSGFIQLQVNNSGSGSAAITSSAIFTQGQRVKIAVGYKQNDFVLYVNGSLIGTDTSGDISSSLAFIDLGTYSLVASTFQYNGTISESVLFPTRLTNAELQALTTI